MKKRFSGMSAPRSEIIYDRDFAKDVQQLPSEAQRKLAKLLRLLAEDAFDSRLRTKSLSAPLQGAFSFRIMRDYRVWFIFHAPHIIKLLAADRRDRIYERLRRKIRLQKPADAR